MSFLILEDEAPVMSLPVSDAERYDVIQASTADMSQTYSCINHSKLSFRTRPLLQCPEQRTILQNVDFCDNSEPLFP
jgi:hypothetical protein